MRFLVGGLLVASVVTSAALTRGSGAHAQSAPEADVVVVGAGIAGLSTALEAARGGASVLVLDMWSVFGGHAVMSHGGLCIVGTPVQESAGIEDSPELAEKDFHAWGEDADPGWVSFYVRRSKELIYDWVSAMGVTFSEGVTSIPGNSVARFHNPDGRGLGLVSPIYRACLLEEGVRFRFNFEVEGLIVEGGRVGGIRGRDVRSGERDEIRAGRVVLATGGFQSNLDMVREHWPSRFDFPEKVLVGSGVNSVGSGHAMAEEAGADLVRMDHQWNYPTGLPDPRHPGANRGLNASNSRSIWVNAQGKRFVNELEGDKVRFRALLAQKPARYWAVFDEPRKRQMFVSGSDWASFETIERVLLENEELSVKAGTLEELEKKTGLPEGALVATVGRYNEMVEEGVDEDFGRFGAGSGAGYDLTETGGSRSGPPAPKIESPPFYALPFFPLSRKSMGGVRIDLETRVLDERGLAVPGLHAVGEVSGFGGINGRAGLEGTFLGPSIVTGRVAGRALLASLGKTPAEMLPTSPPAEERRPRRRLDQTSCETCHDLEDLLSTPRPGYSHFENAHRVVEERRLRCGDCHQEMFPYDAKRHEIDRLAQIETCRSCHLAAER